MKRIQIFDIQFTKGSLLDDLVNAIGIWIKKWNILLNHRIDNRLKNVLHLYFFFFLLYASSKSALFLFLLLNQLGTLFLPLYDVYEIFLKHISISFKCVYCFCSFLYFYIIFVILLNSHIIWLRYYVLTIRQTILKI